jgi:hypothetical protein
MVRRMPHTESMKQILDNLLHLQELELKADGASTGQEALRKQIQPAFLEHYDRLRSRGKKGVALVRRGVCGQCHMQVAVGLLNSLHRQDNLYRCASCGAYLYLVEEAPVVMEMPPRSTKPGRRGRPPKVAAPVAS